MSKNSEIGARVDTAIKNRWHAQIKRGFAPDEILEMGLSRCEKIEVEKIIKVINASPEKRRIINPFPKLVKRNKAA